MTVAEPSWRVIVASNSEIGERPVWDAHTRTLLWVDVLAGRIHRSSQAVDPEVDWADSSITVGGVVGAAAPCRGGGIIAGVDSQIRFLDEAGFDRDEATPVAMPTHHRFNDGACDPAGRFVIGTAGSTPTGVLWSIDAHHRATVLLEDITESNGLGWSGDGRLMYFIDSGECVIRRYAYDLESGRVGERLPDLVNLTSRPGVPDGLVVDADGLVWVPQWQGGEIACFDTIGALVARWSVPVTQPTCAGFAGPELNILVLATSWEGMNPDERSKDRWAGHLLAADTPVRGCRPYEYAG